jgi:hypothetical protein
VENKRFTNINNLKYLDTNISCKNKTKKMLKNEQNCINTGNSKQEFYTKFGPEIIHSLLYGDEFWTLRQTDKSN